MFVNSRKESKKLQKDFFCDFCDFLRLVFYGGGWFFFAGTGLDSHGDDAMADDRTHPKIMNTPDKQEQD